MKKFRKNPNAWVKLWKHHAAQPEADRINLLAAQRNEKFLARYGGKISSEWFFPKVLQTLNESPEVYQSADRFIEAADWVVWQLTGVESRNACTAGYKAIWDGESGFPGKEFFKALDPRLENVIDGKMSGDVRQLGECAGGITKAMARMTGLKPGTPVAVANVDAHVAVPAATVTQPGKMVMIMGTSICHMVLERELRLIPGLCGVVKDGILPGYYGYEAGQSAVGDIFAWFIEHGVPVRYHREAQKKRLNIHALLAQKASMLKPGSTGLLAIDWWNGNRSVLTDADLYGLILGFTLNTKPEEIYRALIEATAFGTYKIIKTIEENSLPVEELYACGGLPEKNKLLMQIYADVTGRSIKVAASSQCSALGSAMFGAVAAGTSRGGYANIMEAAGKMAKLKDEVFSPDSHSHKVYQELFSEYDRLHDYFGRGENEVMKRLKRIKLNSKV
jgi:L-ribulokinase